ncbi:MAG: hypothetical protein NXH72_07260 [Hyphomonadaceae bacterium]|nr:hypothetical protein [Hyphomonadaceae bacterium]
MSESVQISEEARVKAQKRRNVWLAWALVAFVVIVGLTTAIRIQETDFSGGDRLYFSGYLDEAQKEDADREAQARYEEMRAAEAEQTDSSEQPDE